MTNKALPQGLHPDTLAVREAVERSQWGEHSEALYLASAAPPVRFPNVYGIDMPTAKELVAHDRSLEEIRQYIGCDALIYQDVEGMKKAVGKLNTGVQGFEASCFDGVYVTGITAEGISRVNEGRIATEEDDVDTSRLSLRNAADVA